MMTKKGSNDEGQMANKEGWVENQKMKELVDENIREAVLERL